MNTIQWYILLVFPSFFCCGMSSSSSITTYPTCGQAKLSEARLIATEEEATAFRFSIIQSISKNFPSLWVCSCDSLNTWHIQIVHVSVKYIYIYIQYNSCVCMWWCFYSPSNALVVVSICPSPGEASPGCGARRGNYPLLYALMTSYETCDM